jgi:hypothetical protein
MLRLLHGWVSLGPGRGILPCMIARRARPRHRVLLEVPRVGTWREWGVPVAGFERRFAAPGEPASGQGAGRVGEAPGP